MMIIGCLFFGRSIISERFEAFEHFLSILICHKHPHINMPLQTIVDYFLSENKSLLHQEHLSKLQTTQWQHPETCSCQMTKQVPVIRCNQLLKWSCSAPLGPWYTYIECWHCSSHFGSLVRYSSPLALWLVLAFILFYDFETTNRYFSSPCFSRI